MKARAPAIEPQRVEQAILLIRGQRVMLDRDLAALYGVETKNLNKAVRRNADRFPPDFMFQLTADEADASRFQIGTLKRGQNLKYLPHAFTQEGRPVPRHQRTCDSARVAASRNRIPRKGNCRALSGEAEAGLS